MIDKRIEFDEMCKINDITTMYFIAPKEMLKTFIPYNDYPEAISMEISLEFATNEDPETRYVNVSVSPTMDIDGTMTDYDWYDIDLPDDEIEELMNLAKENMP